MSDMMFVLASQAPGAIVLQPPIIDNITLTSIGLDVAWSFPQDATGIAGYELWWDDGSGYVRFGTRTYTDETRDIITTTTNNVFYSYKMRSTDGNGVYSAWSNERSSCQNNGGICF